MRKILIAAIAAAGTVISAQAPALAQGASAFPNTDPVLTPPAVYFAPAPGQQGYFDCTGYCDQYVPAVPTGPYEGPADWDRSGNSQVGR